MNYSPALVQLPLVRESSGERVRTPADAYRLCRDIAELAQESFHVLSLDVRNRLIDRQLVSLGLASSSLVHPREAFRQAIVSGASSVVLIHNHPSSDPTPSAEDIRITRQLIQAGRIIDIKVIDHVVIGRPDFVSLREAGLCTFE